MREENYYKNESGPDTTPPAVGDVAAGDPSLYELMVRPWELINTPLERGEFGYRMRYLKTPAITVYQEQFDLRCRIRGLSPQSVFVFSVPVRLGTCSTYWKAPLGQSGFPIMLPSELDVEFGRGHFHLIVIIDLALLDRHLPAELYDTVENAATTHLLRANSTAVERFGNWLLALLEETNCRPYLLQYPASLRSIEGDLLGRLVDVVLALSAPPRTTLPSRRRRGFSRALEFLRDTERASVAIPELSEVAGVSTRTLDHAFREAFDLSPSGFLRLRRFHTARCELLVSDSHQTTVTEIAHKAGFYHLARFAVNYRRLFGEPPSETLKRQFTYTKDRLSPLLRR